MPSKKTIRKWLAAGLKLAIVVAIGWGLHRTVSGALEDLERHEWSLSELRPGWLVAAALAYTVGQLPSSLFWHRLLRTFGQNVLPLATVRAWYVGSLAKYIPGKAMVIVLRTTMLRSRGVGIAVATATIFYETLTTMAVGAFVAGAILLVLFRDRWQLAVLAAALMLVSGAPTVPAIFKRLARLAGIERAAPTMIDRLDHLGRTALAQAWLSIAVGWCLMGFSVYATLQAVDATSSESTATLLATTIAATGLSVVAGFVSFIPGGLVVRDAVLLELLAPAVGDGPALVGTLVARLVWLLSELAVSTILYSLKSLAGPDVERPGR